MSNTTRRPRVYLVGVAGNPNLGDELIVEAWLRYLDTHLPDADVWLDTPFPGPATALLAPRHPRIHVTDTLFRLRDRAEAGGAADIGHFMTMCLADPGHVPWWTAGIDVVKDADVVHLVGGGYANEIWPHNLALFDALGWLARHTAARVGVTGVGLLPLGEPAASRVAGAARAFTVMDVRDPGTARVVAGADGDAVELRLTGDDILLSAPEELLDEAGAASVDVGVVVQDDLREIAREDLVAFVRRQVGEWGAKPDRVAVVECIPRGDGLIHDALVEEWPELRLIPFQQVWRDGFPARAGQRWISTRYHPHLLAAMAGAAGVAISLNGEYYAVKHDLVRAAGSGWQVLDETLTERSPAEPVQLPDRLPRLRSLKQETAELLYAPFLGEARQRPWFSRTP